MIFECSDCKKLYDEKDEEQSAFGQAGCEMICYSCYKMHTTQHLSKYPELNAERQQGASVNTVKVSDQKPSFGEKCILHTKVNGQIQVLVTRNPFSEEDNEHYWMFTNPRTNNPTWLLIRDYDLWQPERSKREDPEMGCGTLNSMET